MSVTDNDHSYHSQPQTEVTSSPSALPFLQLEPMLSEDDYKFALEQSEGIQDLFDDDLNMLMPDIHDEDAL